MKLRIASITAAALLALGIAAHAADKKDKKPAAKAKPYPLKTCIVQDEKLDKDAYVFVYKGQEIKMCCSSCKEDFDKDPAKFLKKLEKPAK